jgi:hypothetical protein
MINRKRYVSLLLQITMMHDTAVSMDKRFHWGGSDITKIHSRIHIFVQLSNYCSEWTYIIARIQHCLYLHIISPYYIQAQHHLLYSRSSRKNTLMRLFKNNVYSLIESPQNSLHIFYHSHCTNEVATHHNISPVIGYHRNGFLTNVKKIQKRSIIYLLFIHS